MIVSEWGIGILGVRFGQMTTDESNRHRVSANVTAETAGGRSVFLQRRAGLAQVLFLIFLSH